MTRTDEINYTQPVLIESDIRQCPEVSLSIYLYFVVMIVSMETRKYNHCGEGGPTEKLHPQTAYICCTQY